MNVVFEELRELLEILGGRHREEFQSNNVKFFRRFLYCFHKSFAVFFSRHLRVLKEKSNTDALFLQLHQVFGYLLGTPKCWFLSLEEF